MGWVGFPGTLLPPVESLGSLAEIGVSYEALPAAEDVRWRARLRHDSWGEAEVFAFRGLTSLPKELVAIAPSATAADKAMAGRADCGLLVRARSRQEHLLRDRKDMLRFMRALLGDAGLVAIDLCSWLHWSPTTLDDELSHGAPLDIDQVHCLHAVSGDDELSTDPSPSDKPVEWLHSHGLGDIGFVDFDILRPGQEVMENQMDLVRALGFAIVEGATSGTVELVIPSRRVELVDVASFSERASDADLAVRQSEGHDQRRVIVCDPPGSGGLLSWFGRKKDQPRPARLFREGMKEGRDLVHFSLTATELMAERARETAAAFDSLRQEFEWLDAKGLVKLGYPVDGGDGSDSAREHIWFEVHGLDVDGVDATCINQPFDVARLSEGQRGRHSLELLSDWTILTPVGNITPRSLGIGRSIRENETEIRKLLEEARSE